MENGKNGTLLDELRKNVSLIEKYEQKAAPFFNIEHYKNNMSRVYSAVTGPNSGGVVVYGDYDADGIISATILYGYLRALAYRYRSDFSEDFIRMEFSDRQNSFGMTEDEFQGFRKEGRLVVTVDNGSALPFLQDDTEGLLVIDHHPEHDTPPYPYIINPNIGRSDSLSYSTSGGRVVYDFILNIEENLKRLDPSYEGVPVLMGVLRNLAALTLISDMATLDRKNREFVIEALNSISSNPTKIPVFSLLREDYSSRAISFNIISPLNGMSRMEQNLHTVAKWILPETLEEWLEANDIIQSNNRKKKKAVRIGAKKVMSYLREHGSSSGRVNFAYVEGRAIGIIGLLANQVSGSEHNSPTIVCTLNNSGDLVFSARGEGVKGDLEKILKHCKGLSSEDYVYGGHPEACGGKIKSSALQREGLEGLIRNIHESIDHLSRTGEIGSDPKLSVPSLVSRPVSVREGVLLQKEFSMLCHGVEYHRKAYYIVEQYEVEYSKTGASGWTQIKIRDKHKPGDNTGETGELTFWAAPGKGEEITKGNHPILLEFTPNGDASYHSTIPRDRWDAGDVEIINIANEKKFEESVDMDHKKNKGTETRKDSAIKMEKIEEERPWFDGPGNGGGQEVMDRDEKDATLEEILKELGIEDLLAEGNAREQVQISK